MKTRSLAATLILVVLAAAPLALAQTAKKPKKGGKGAASASASAAPEPTPEPAPPAPPETAAAPEDSASAAPTDLPATPPEVASEAWKEDSGKRYLFVGLRYRGNLIPKFLINTAVDGGASVYSNVFGLELDSRKDGFSQVFALSYADYNTGDLVFHESGKDSTPQNWSLVNSTLKAIYASVDLLWSVPIGDHLDFEYGLGAGLGVIFGNLENNWLYIAASGQGPLTGYDGNHYTPCQTTKDAPSCDPLNHSQATTAKVGNYTEPAGLFGPKPILFPMLNIPQLGLRYKATKEIEARLGLGFGITGFWFGLSADYGIDNSETGAGKATKASKGPTLHGML
ncbi:MAG TPA: hypothetical protein VIF15_01315 [Polyangiaceae bacterium]|jgi:hypothetical protein